MKIPLQWLRDFVAVPWSVQETGDRLTMAGFELEGIAPVAGEFTDVVVAQILSAEKHPQADKLQVCKVSTGSGAPLQIVCGAPNARAGLVTALARVGAQLPGGMQIKAAKLRGVESAGMLCSTRELGLSDAHEGIIELPADAPLGEPLREYLRLDDSVLELNVTPNRGDAMSVLGVAREVAALQAVNGGASAAGISVKAPVAEPAANSKASWPVRVEAGAACPRFLSRVIEGLDNRGSSPLWLRERLRRAGVRSISPVVDVTQYVMLELGQPMHAYDRDKLQGAIVVRLARQDEKIELLDGRTVALQEDVLVIADDAGPVGMAGVMGGLRSAVTPGTANVVLEVAFFAPAAIAGRGRRVGLTTDASQRFERGVDFSGAQRAMARATSLLLAHCGGSAAPVQVNESAALLPKRAAVTLRRAQLARLLGTDIADAQVATVLAALQMDVKPTADGWSVTPPAHRFDIAIEADLAEEVARIVGYGQIPEQAARLPHHFRSMPEGEPLEWRVADALAARGWFEAINFAFVDPAMQGALFPGVPAATLANPIASDLAVMRVSLWSGLLKSARENLRRQAECVKLFEIGAVFVSDATAADAAHAIPGAIERPSIAGVAAGLRAPEQWGAQKANVDFFDVRADVEALLAASGSGAEFSFQAEVLSCLHPGRSARVLRDGRPVGWIGELHPELVRQFDLTYAPVLFELDLTAALLIQNAAFSEVSKFPAVRRDLALVVDEQVSFAAIHERVTLTASTLLKSARVFDVYRGAGVENGRKSVAISLIFQDDSRTLTDADTDQLVAAVRADLSATLNAKLRE